MNVSATDGKAPQTFLHTTGVHGFLRTSQEHNYRTICKANEGQKKNQSKS